MNGQLNSGSKGTIATRSRTFALRKDVYTLSTYQRLSIKGALFAAPLLIVAALALDKFQGVLAPGNGWGNFTGILSFNDIKVAVAAIAAALIAGHFSKMSVAMGSGGGLAHNLGYWSTVTMLIVLLPFAAATVFVSFLSVTMRVAHYFGSGKVIPNEMAQAGWMVIPLVCVALVYGQVANGYMNR